MKRTIAIVIFDRVEELDFGGRLWGTEQARRVQEGVEYFPDSPYADVPMPAFDRP